MEYCKLRYGNKGFVLSLDALVSIILVFVVIAVLSSTMQNKESLNQIYLAKTGSDIAALVDNNNLINSLNSTLLRQEISNITQMENVEINITTFNTDLSGRSSLNFTTSPYPEGFVSSGKRFFVIKNNNQISKFGVINYRIWKK
ncbi:MAG: hypothetical protein V1660_03705 [archaeon]